MKNISFFTGIVFLLTIIASESYSKSTVDTRRRVEAISDEISEIRGLKFKRPVKVKKQSLKEFGKYLDKVLEEQMPETRLKNYGKIVKKLGLYRGTEIKDFASMTKAVMQSQVAAYYDPESGTFYVVMQNLPEQMLGGLYAHELHHGLQDQYFNLDKYILSQAGGTLNDDEVLARQAVVEGEATYIMTLWSMQKMLGILPDREILKLSIYMQAEMNSEMMITMLKSGMTSQFNQTATADAIKTLEEIPAFIVETLMGAYQKGMRFVFDIQSHGWDRVSRLYRNAPVSTEQILYPEKWLKGEKPFKYQWPSFKQKTIFGNWDLLDVNTIGEIQWRIIFSEHEMSNAAKKASDGWDGDIYAILKNKNSGDLLLLFYTSWDTDNDASEFAENYKNLLKIKYQDNSIQLNVETIGKDVLVVEGGKEISTDDILDFMKQIKKIK